MGSGLPRVVDAVLALVGLVLAAPFIGLAALAVKLTSAGPVLFRQQRAGRGGRPFELLKLRTMAHGASGLQVTAGDDLRITAVGKVLRRTKLDELPELWNVVRGDMALVGPRPEVPRYVDLEDVRWREVLRVRPGITDPVTLSLRNEEGLLASVGGDRDELYRLVLQPYKLEGYLAYQRRRSVWTDVGVIVLTVLTVMGFWRGINGQPDGLVGAVAEWVADRGGKAATRDESPGRPVGRSG